MGALFVGAISGIICAAISLFLGTSWLTGLAVYSVSGILAAVAHAVVVALFEPALLRRRNPDPLTPQSDAEDE